MPVSVTNKTSSTLPRVPFSVYMSAVLGKKYELSVVFVSPKEMQKLNKQYRKKNKSTDVLSFPLSKNSGEIFFSIPDAKKEAVKFDRSYANFMKFLTIHALAHLAGFDHGQKMEAFEARFRTKFAI